MVSFNFIQILKVHSHPIHPMIHVQPNFYSEKRIQHTTSYARMDSGKLTMIRYLQTIIGVVSREFAGK